MNVGDGAGVGIVSTRAHSKTDCPFCCEETPPEPKQNNLVNSAASLRGSLNAIDMEPNFPGSDQTWEIVCTDPANPSKKVPSKVRSNPHHLIPGNASLKPNSIVDIMDSERGQIKSDIGYNVNGAANGIWLPTIPQVFYAGDQHGPKLMKWGVMTKDYPAEQFSHAEKAMMVAKRQFHDAHPDYSNHVAEKLNELHLLVIDAAWNCPEVTSSADEKAPPPYGLVAMLDGLSDRMAQSLKGIESSWRWPKFTSRHAEKFSSRSRGV